MLTRLAAPLTERGTRSVSLRPAKSVPMRVGSPLANKVIRPTGDFIGVSMSVVNDV
jgi:hypothetical protein